MFNGFDWDGPSVLLKAYIISKMWNVYNVNAKKQLHDWIFDWFGDFRLFILIVLFVSFFLDFGLFWFIYFLNMYIKKYQKNIHI